MAEHQGQHSGRLSTESRAKMQAEERFLDANRTEMNREALARQAELDVLIEAFRQLKTQREAKGLTVSDIAERSGIDKDRLAELENDPYPSPSLTTLTRIAGALNVRLKLAIEDKDAA